MVLCKSRFNILNLKIIIFISTVQITLEENDLGTSLVVQWLRLSAPNAGSPGSIPGQGTRSHMPQLRVHMPQLKVPHAATKDPECHN